MVNRVTFLAQISTLSYIVKNFKLGFLKKGSPKKFETQDLKWSLSTCKKLLKHFLSDIFLFQGISEHRCELLSKKRLQFSKEAFMHPCTSISCKVVGLHLK